MSRTIGLRTRLTLTTVPLVLLTMTILTVLLLVLARTLYLDNTETLLLGQARMVSESAVGIWGDNAAIDRLAKTLGVRAGARITIIATDGTVLGDSEVDPATMENHAGRPEVVELVTRQSGVSVRYSVTTGRQLVYTAVPIVRAGAMVGVARVSWPLDEVNARLDLLRNIAIIGIAISGILAALLAWLLSRYIIRPIDALTGVAGAMAAGDLDRRSDPRGTDEIGRLGLAFNRMADELSETIEIISDERARLAAILETMGDGLLVIDHDGMILLANSAAERLLQPYARPPRDGRRREVRGRALIAVAIDHELDGLVRETQRARRGIEPAPRSAERAADDPRGRRSSARRGLRHDPPRPPGPDRGSPPRNGAARLRRQHFARAADAARLDQGGGGDPRRGGARR